MQCPGTGYGVCVCVRACVRVCVDAGWGVLELGDWGL